MKLSLSAKKCKLSVDKWVQVSSRWVLLTVRAAAASSGWIPVPLNAERGWYEAATALWKCVEQRVSV